MTDRAPWIRKVVRPRQGACRMALAALVLLGCSVRLSLATLIGISVPGEVDSLLKAPLVFVARDFGPRVSTIHPGTAVELSGFSVKGAHSLTEVVVRIERSTSVLRSGEGGAILFLEGDAESPPLTVLRAIPISRESVRALEQKKVAKGDLEVVFAEALTSCDDASIYLMNDLVYRASPSPETALRHLDDAIRVRREAGDLAWVDLLRLGLRLGLTGKEGLVEEALARTDLPMHRVNVLLNTAREYNIRLSAQTLARYRESEEPPIMRYALELEDGFGPPPLRNLLRALDHPDEGMRRRASSLLGVRVGPVHRVAKEFGMPVKDQESAIEVWREWGRRYPDGVGAPRIENRRVIIQGASPTPRAQ